MPVLINPYFGAGAGGSITLGTAVVAVTAVDARSASFNGISTGTAAGNRKMVLLTCCQTDGGGQLLNAVNATGSPTITTAVSIGSSAGPCAILIWDQPTGTTTDITISWAPGGSAVFRMGMVLIPVYGLTSSVANDTKITSAHPYSVTINCPANGAIFGVAHGNNNAASNGTWTGLTERAEQNMEDGPITVAADTFASAQTARAIGCTLSVAPGITGAAFASFG